MGGRDLRVFGIKYRFGYFYANPNGAQKAPFLRDIWS